MISVAIIGIVAMLLAIQFKGIKSEFGIYISLAACIMMIGFGVDKLSVILTALDQIKGYLAIPTVYITMFIKMLGITYLCEFAASLCKDGGFTAIASQLELFGKLSVLALSAPVILALFETIERLLNI